MGRHPEVVKELRALLDSQHNAPRTRPQPNWLVPRALHA
jgi:hypothetical protein